MARIPPIETVCTNCGGTSLVTEPELDVDQIPTGALLVMCDACGCELGRMVVKDYVPEAEPAVEGEILIPSEGELPRSA